MAELQNDYNFELNGVVFGIDQKVSCDEDGFQPGDPEVATSSTPNPTGQGVLPGRDLRGAATWGFDLHVDGKRDTDALASLSELRNAWWHETTEDTPGAFDTLRYRLAGRTRRIYGRARRWTPALGNRLLSGLIPITADFEQMDPLIYDDYENVVEVTAYGGPPVAGIEAPLEAPLVSVGDVDVVRPGEVLVGGTHPTWPVIEFFGSQINPWVTLNNWRFELVDVLGPDDTVRADSRPLVRTTLRNGYGQVKVGNLSRLGVMALPPGNYTVGYGALSVDGTAGVRVRWHDAHKSI